MDFADRLAQQIANAALEIAKDSVLRMSKSPKGVVWTWDTIKGFGQAKALKASYVFLFLVPILARLLENLPPALVIPIWETMVEIPLALPFSWLILFLSACFASMGNIIYSVFCPELIKEYEDHPSFDAKERNGTYLRSYVQRLSFLKSNDEISNHVSAIHDLYNSVPIDVESLVRYLNGDLLRNTAGFYFVRDSVNLSQPLIRLAASISYFLAFACLGVIAIQNMVYVAMYFGK